MTINRIKTWLAVRIIRPAVLALSKIVAAGLKKYVDGDSAYEIFSRQGFHLLRKHFYLPIPEEEDLRDGFWEKRSELVGVEMNDAGSLDLLQNVFPRYTAEFREHFPLRQTDKMEPFYLINGMFMAVDAHVYYMFIRHFRPKRIVEIGSGYSTLLAARACLGNMQDDGGSAAQLTCVEPFPMPFLRDGFPGLSQLVQKRVQEVDMELFTALEAGDILFIDSTHVLRAGGDVQLEYCEILPRLAPGVLVHIHDISLPKPYPRIYFEEHHHYWNEQYLLQAFLAFNSRFEVLWPGNYMMEKYPERVTGVFPEYHQMREAFPSSEPSSFWMRVRPS
ncbi:MAG TPA: class I SAM-dependent methyltransferase [Pyrinomonadaceae bacterium]|nr:class I SAM-dependent methyltransferase [Pyrinomonadaceae bacterium]